MDKKSKKIRKAKLLVLDDEIELIDTFKLLMGQFGYNADFFDNPKSALQAIQKNGEKYQVVITDIRMPDLNGLELAKKIRAIHPKLPIIFMTGYPSDEIRDQASAIGLVAFLEKPFKLEKTFDELIPKLLEEAAS